MYKFKICLISLLILSAWMVKADPTIVGFEETLNNEDKERLNSFIAGHKKKGYSKCYYQNNEDTVVCENQSQEKVYFK